MTREPSESRSRSGPKQELVLDRALQGGTLSFTWVGIFGGGDPLNTVPDLASALDIRADQYMPPTEVLHVHHVLIRDSASQAIQIRESGTFTAASNGLVITKSKGFPNIGRCKETLARPMSMACPQNPPCP